MGRYSQPNKISDPNSSSDRVPYSVKNIWFTKYVIIKEQKEALMILK